MKWGYLLWGALLFNVVALAAEEGEPAGAMQRDAAIPLYDGKQYIHVLHGNKSIRIERVQDRDYELTGYFAKTSRECPPFCLHPIQVDPRVKTVGEIEVLQFMERQLRDGTGMLVDARTPSWYGKGTIPGSVNLPFTQLSRGIDEPEMIEALKLFGAKQRKNGGGMARTLEELGLIDSKHKTEKWDFSRGKDLVLWCNGPACGQSPRAINGLLRVGYPPEKLFYYRGGMQIWQLFGLTTVVPEN